MQELQAQHETFKNTTLKEGDGYYEALNGLAEQLAAAGSSENPYTAHTPQVGGSGWLADVDHMHRPYSNVGACM